MVIIKSALLLLWAARLVAAATTSQHKIWPAASDEQYTTTQSTVLRTVTIVLNDKHDLVFDFKWEHDEITQKHPVTLHALQQAQERFVTALRRGILQDQPPKDAARDDKDNHTTLVPLQGLSILLEDPDAPFQHGVDESYDLHISDTAPIGTLSAKTLYGALYGLQTFQQLFEYDSSESAHGNSSWPVMYVIADTPLSIQDAPQYPYRGLLVDTSRHYMPFPLLVYNLDAMAMNKLNVFHWHMTDRESWPYQSTAFPELSEKGAFCTDCIYTAEQVQQLIAQAALRGIHVVIEMDLPGHSQALAASRPEMFTGDCTNHCKTYQWFHGECPKDKQEPLDVTNPAVFPFVRDLYLEIEGLFPTQCKRWLHVGGDEVALDCWRKSPKIQSWMKRNGIKSELELVANFEKDLLDLVVNELEHRPIVWQELFDSGFDLPNKTIVDIWKGWDYRTTLAAATQEYDVVLSANWYLDWLDHDWQKFYDVDPVSTLSTDTQKAHVLGGHAAMWAERVDESNFFSRVYPRAAAMGERLWSNPNPASSVKSSSHERLKRFRCRMIQQLGIPVSPVSPGRCERSSYHWSMPSFDSNDKDNIGSGMSVDTNFPPASSAQGSLSMPLSWLVGGALLLASFSVLMTILARRCCVRQWEHSLLASEECEPVNITNDDDNDTEGEPNNDNDKSEENVIV